MPELVQYQRVMMEGKAVALETVKEVSGGKKKQDVVVADNSGSIQVTVWEAGSRPSVRHFIYKDGHASQFDNCYTWSRLCPKPWSSCI